MTVFDPLHYPYPSQRMTVYANRGMVAASQPLAAEAGLSMLRQGGNAVDAAIATAAALTVVEPTSNGIGGDNFAIVHHQGALHGLNASGPAPMALTRDALAARGLSQIPAHGPIPVTVPGAPAGWAALSQKFGNLPFAQVLAPAIDLAENGFPLSPTLGKYWARAFAKYEELGITATSSQHRDFCELFAPGGRVPGVGEVFYAPRHADTLRRIANSNARDFYEGDLADAIDRFFQTSGGFLRKSDLASYAPEWVQPVHVHYHGYDVWELPPNGQGIVALLALNLLSGFPLTVRESVDTYHLSIEALKLALSDGLAQIADPRQMQVSVADLLSSAYADERRRQIDPARASLPAPGQPLRGGTVYFATADSAGGMVSMIQSNYLGFGACIVAPGTGISFHSRGLGFSLDPAHPNCLQPGRRPYHTIMPGFLTKQGQPVGPFGVMGGFMQAQGHLQVIQNAIDFGMNPQSALDAPRWQWVTGKRVLVEPAVARQIAEELVRRGHAVEVALDSGSFGRGQIIWRLANGVLAGGTEARTDGAIAAW